MHRLINAWLLALGVHIVGLALHFSGASNMSFADLAYIVTVYIKYASLYTILLQTLVNWALFYALSRKPKKQA